jgi:hypothetical protein
MRFSDGQDWITAVYLDNTTTFYATNTVTTNLVAVVGLLPSAITADSIRVNTLNLNDYGLPAAQGYDTLSGIVAHYKMNDNAASTLVADSSGYGRNGTATANTSTLSVAGKTNTALAFNTQYVNLGDTVDMGRSNMTVACWMKTTSTSQSRLLSKQTYGEGGWALMSWAGNYAAVLTGNPGGGEIITMGTIPVKDGNWHHIVGVWDRLGNAVLYVDGVQDGAGQTIVPYALSDISNGLDLKIAMDTPNNEPFNGTIDDVRIYYRILSAVDIAALYNSGNGSESAIISPTVTNLRTVIATNGTVVVDAPVVAPGFIATGWTYMGVPTVTGTWRFGVDGVTGNMMFQSFDGTNWKTNAIIQK